MSHLGSWVSALVDGQLAPPEAERALAHVASCPSCADEVAAARQARRALSVAPDVVPDPELTARLLALGTAATPPAGPRREHQRAVVPLGESAYAVPAKALSGDLMGRRRSPARLLAGTLGGLGVVLGVLFVLGDRPAVVPATHPAEALTALGAAPQASPPSRTDGARLVTALATTPRPATTGTAVPDPADGAAVVDWMHREGWSGPAALPAGYRVTAVRITAADDDAGTGEVLRVDLAGPRGRMVLTEQRGRLDVEALGPAERLTLDGRTVHLLSRHPWHAVWQCGDTVVSLVSEAPAELAETLVTRFPPHAYDDGIPARLTRGWDTVTGALANP